MRSDVTRVVLQQPRAPSQADGSTPNGSHALHVLDQTDGNQSAHMYNLPRMGTMISQWEGFLNTCYVVLYYLIGWSTGGLHGPQEWDLAGHVSVADVDCGNKQLWDQTLHWQHWQSRGGFVGKNRSQLNEKCFNPHPEWAYVANPYVAYGQIQANFHSAQGEMFSYNWVHKHSRASDNELGVRFTTLVVR